MKKTLITLAALAAVSTASAATTIENTYYESDFVDGKLTLDTALSFKNDWTLTLTVDLKSTFERTNETYYGEVVLSTNSNPVANKDAQMLRVYQTDDDNSLRETVFALNGAEQTLGTNPSIRLIGSNTLTFDYDAETRIITMTAVGTYSTANDGTGATAINKSIASSVIAAGASDITFFTSTILGADKPNSITSIKTSVNVPEPATATLSLLALAGLAARRRRK